MAVEAIVLASDHAGYDLKETLKQALVSQSLEVIDLGCDGPQSVDYPMMADRLVDAIGAGRASRGVLICGTGIGISIAANRASHIRCALCHDVTTTRLARQHNDANVLALGARIIGSEVALQCLEAFLATAFGGERHARRVAMLGRQEA